jgi:hypothetical protein
MTTVQLLLRGILRRLKAQERYPYETRWEGFRAEQDVKRLRKPEGVAEPGKWNPGG